MDMNKPVAWVELEAWLSGECYPDDCFGDKEFTGSIPLYTHPVKELTDEQILNLFEPKYDVEIDDEMLINFARTILRKAQEQ